MATQIRIEQLKSVSTGAANNDKPVSQGYVDDAVAAGGTPFSSAAGIITPTTGADKLNMSGSEIINNTYRSSVDNGITVLYGSNTTNKGACIALHGASTATFKGNMYLRAGDDTAVGSQGDVYIQRMNNGSTQDVAKFTSYRAYLYSQVDIGFASSTGDFSLTFCNNKGTKFIKHKYSDQSLEIDTAVSSYVAEDTNFATNAVLTTGVASYYGTLTVRESVDGVCGIYRVEGTTIVVISANAAFTTTKDNAGTYNIYWDTTEFKLQNKVGNSKNARVSFSGPN